MVSEVGWRRTIKTRMLKDSFQGQPQRIPDMVREGTPSREDWACALMVIRRRPAATLPLESQGLHEVEIASSWPEPAVAHAL